MAKSVGWGALTTVIVFIASILIGWVLLSYTSGNSPFEWWIGQSGWCSLPPDIQGYDPVCDPKSLISLLRKVSTFVFLLGAPVTSLAAGIIVAVRREKKRRRTSADIATS